VEQEGIVCSGCNTLNEVGWAFCQQCGKRLVQPQPVPSPPPAQPPAEISLGLKTVADQQAVADPRSAESFRTVVAKAPQVDQGLRTVSQTPTPADRDFRTVVATPPPPFDQESKTVRQEPKTAEIEVAPETPVKPPPPPAPPAKIVEAPVPAPPRATRPGTPAEPPKVAVPPKAAAPPPPPKPAVPPPVVTPEPATLLGQPASGVLCGQCGQASGVGSAFCASCGAPITYGRTMIISSQPAAKPVPPRGSLHLVMEGGQSGEVYELGEDTGIGRSSGKITFPHDGFMSGRHARIELRGRSFILTDDGSRNGTFIKIKGEVELKPGDTILVGKQLFRFEIVE
jgi:hypothetical protein